MNLRAFCAKRQRRPTQGVNDAETGRAPDEVACMSERTAQIPQGSIMRPGPGNADPFRKVYEWWDGTKPLGMYTMSSNEA